MSEASGCAAGVLYVVATPIGNPEDLSARAIRILGEVDLIACEDTRRTGRLLSAHAIRTPTTSYFEHNEDRRTPDLIRRLKSGARIALVSDAGTPTISDPGFRLAHEAVANGIRVTAVPGPSAVVAALSIAGLATGRFAFEGFLPPKSSTRRALLKRLVNEERTLVFFEAARRLAETLSEMAEALGNERNAAVVREITKTHEEVARGTLAELANRYAKEAALGEVTLVVEGGKAAPGAEALDDARIVEVLCDAGLGLKQATAAASALTGHGRRDIYQRMLRARRGG